MKGRVLETLGAVAASAAIVCLAIGLLMLAPQLAQAQISYDPSCTQTASCYATTPPCTGKCSALEPDCGCDNPPGGNCYCTDEGIG